MAELAALGLRILAPPLLDAGAGGSGRADRALGLCARGRAAGLDLITWSLERSGPLKDGGGYYYRSIRPLIDRDGDMLALLDVLYRDVGVRGVFSDWPATTTFYANCVGIE